MDGGPDPEEELVALVREIGRRLHAGEVGAGTAAAAMDHLRAVAELVADAVPRRRWGDAGTPVAPAGVQEKTAGNRELSAFSGSLNPVAPPMRVEAATLPDGRSALLGRVRLDRLREGPPNCAHGGVIAGLFDEMLGGGQRLGGGPPAMTGRLTVRYRRPTPLDTDLEFWAWIHDERSRRVVVRGQCLVRPDVGPEIVTAEAEAVFLRVDFAQLEQIMGGNAA